MAVSIASFTIKDATGDTKSVAVYFEPASATLAQIQSWVTALSALIDNLTDGVLIAANLTIGATLDAGVKTEVTGDPDIQRGALLGFSADGTAYRHSLWIPAFLDAAFTGDVVDLDNAGVQALEAWLNTPTNGIQGTDKYDNDIVALLEGVKSFRK